MHSTYSPTTSCQLAVRLSSTFPSLAWNMKWLSCPQFALLFIYHPIHLSVNLKEPFVVGDHSSHSNVIIYIYVYRCPVSVPRSPLIRYLLDWSALRSSGHLGDGCLVSCRAGSYPSSRGRPHLQVPWQMIQNEGLAVFKPLVAWWL